MQPVGRDDEHVALLDRDLYDVRRHLWTSPQHPGDEVTPLVALGLVLAYEALLELFLHPGVVLGELVDLLAAHEVATRVTDVPYVRVAPPERHARERGAHTAAPLLLDGSR